MEDTHSPRIQTQPDALFLVPDPVTLSGTVWSALVLQTQLMLPEVLWAKYYRFILWLRNKGTLANIALSLVVTGGWQYRVLSSFCCSAELFILCLRPCLCPHPSSPGTGPRVCAAQGEMNFSLSFCSGATILGRSHTPANSCFQIRSGSIHWTEIQKYSLACEAVLKIVNGMIILNIHMAILKVRASLVAQLIKNLPALQQNQVQSLGREDPLEEGMVTHSHILAWEIPGTEEPCGLQSMELQRKGHKLVTYPPPHPKRLFLFFFSFLVGIFLYIFYCSFAP